MDKHQLQLNVWCDHHLVGQIQQDASSIMGFSYHPKWIDNHFPISQQLPLSIQQYSAEEAKAHQFFANLLPEANARAHIVKDLKIADSDFELLKVIGGECAGALSILPIDCVPSTETSYKKLTDKELTALLMRKGNMTNLLEERRFRLSLAGAQDKCLFFYHEGQYFIPTAFSPSTHIMKFELSDYKHIPAYEYFLTALAKTIPLPVVECELKRKENYHFLLIKRYDRVLTLEKKIGRLHQEDFCQAMGIHHSKKYQADGGPSFHNCYELIQNSSINPIIDAENLLKWQIFNLLCGNSDGHAKNISLIYNKQHQVSLAPFYDLVCTRAIERIDADLALSIGGEFDPRKVSIKHWMQLAKDCSIRPEYLMKILKNTAATLLKNCTLVRDQFEKIHGSYPALQRAQQVITKQCLKTLKQL